MPSFEEFYNAIKKTIQEEPQATEEQKQGALESLEKSMPFIKAMDDKFEELGLSKEEAYILDYLLNRNQNQHEKLSAYDFTVIQLTTMMFVHDHKKEIVALNDQETRTQFIASLEPSDYQEIKVDPDNEEIKALKNNPAPSLDDLLNALGFGNAVHIYERHSKKLYRTRAKAQDSGAYSGIPSSLAIPTVSPYQYSMSLYQNGNAYLQPLTSTDGLKFKSGKMYFDSMQQVSEVELQNMKTKEGIENIDLALLRVFYSIILSAFEASKCKELKDVITLFVPDLAEYLGLQRNLNKKNIDGVIAKVQSFHNIVGILHGTRNGKPSQSIYPVLNFEGYDDKKNTIAFSSPYMNHVIRTVYNVTIRRGKDGKPRLKKNGDPLRLVSHSYLVHGSITKQKNKAAVENVNIIVTLIEQAGDNVPRIKASTIIERNPQLQNRLEADSSHKAQLLKRVFSKTWELLRTETDLQRVYKDIQLPDPKDPAFIPTVKNLDSLVFTFPHGGKKEAP